MKKKLYLCTLNDILWMKNRLFFIFTCLVGFAVCANAAIYSRVSAKPEAGWEGTYLIVYETGNNAYVWDGTDDTNNYMSVTLTNGKITSDALASYLVTVTSEGNNRYGVKAKDGYISTDAKSNGITFSKGAVDCTIAANGGYVMLETNTNTCRFVYHTSAKRFRFYYDKDKEWDSNVYQNIRFYAEGDNDPEPSNLDINYAQAEMYACESKFPTQSNPYYQYYSTFLWLLQEEDEDAVPQVGLEILAPTQYSIAGTYKSDYSNTSSGYINITAGSKHSYFMFPSKAEAGYSTAAINVAEMKITKVGKSQKAGAYTYHIKLEFTDSNKKIWTLDKDLDVYAWWIDCDRSGKELEDMEPVAFTLESGNHKPAGLHQVAGDRLQVTEKVMKDGKIYLLVNGEYYSISGNKIK